MQEVLETHCKEQTRMVTQGFALKKVDAADPEMLVLFGDGETYTML